VVGSDTFPAEEGCDRTVARGGHHCHIQGRHDRSRIRPDGLSSYSPSSTRHLRHLRASYRRPFCPVRACASASPVRRTVESFTGRVESPAPLAPGHTPLASPLAGRAVRAPRRPNGRPTVASGRAGTGRKAVSAWGAPSRGRVRVRLTSRVGTAFGPAILAGSRSGCTLHARRTGLLASRPPGR
jgi:hypothetical protein